MLERAGHDVIVYRRSAPIHSPRTKTQAELSQIDAKAHGAHVS
jgi:hypothetical protein